MPFVKPTNKVLVGGNPIIDELVAEGTTLAPRLFVRKGTGDHQAQLAVDGEIRPLGILDMDPRYKITDAFADKAPVKVLKGPIVVVAKLAASQTITKGQALVCAANGEVKAAATISVSVPAGATAVTSTAAQPDLLEIGSIPPYGVIVGFAEETISTGAGETKPILMRLVF
jgi:hypothetical protein